MISYALAFTPNVDYQRTPVLGSRSTTERDVSVSSLMIDGCNRAFSRNAALAMATELKYSDDESGTTNSTTDLFSRVETVFPTAEIVTITLDDHIPLGCTVEESLHEDDDFILITKLTKGGNAAGAGLKVGDVLVGVTGLFGDLTCTLESDVDKM